MIVVFVLIEHATLSLDRPFSYCYDGPIHLERGMRVLVSFGKQKLVGFIERVEETRYTKEELSIQYGFELAYVDSVLDERPLLNEELLSLADEVASYYLAPKISVLQAMLPRSLRPASSSLKSPKIAYETYVECVDDHEEGLTDKQIELLRLLKESGPILKKECGHPSIVEKLHEAKRIRFKKVEKQRFKVGDYLPSEPFPLTHEQQTSFDKIVQSDKSVILLQGITGSGKTEVYLHLSDYYMNQGKTILMLVPEIALTPVMVDYFARRFQNKVAILHSGLTPAEKYDEYRRIARGEAQIVVGARSAIFAPLTNIGLIIIDEEHVESYKQDNAPYYHARVVGEMRAKFNHCKLVLGSATPSIETKARASKGVYDYTAMNKRVHENPLPPTRIIDLSKRDNCPKGERYYSKALLEGIEDRVKKGEQVMLLINRRGYASFVTCSDCGHVFTCPSCSGNLVYHRNDEMLKCHRCGFVQQYPSSCPTCGSTNLMRVGFGTERVVKTLLEHFPDLRVGRLDSDVGKVKNQVDKVLKSFSNQEYDVLVGTQMIAKGHDFPLVTLVGVVLADIGLSLPSFRANEATFQLIAQCVGRSGRGEKQGEALIQTYNPTHYAITLGAAQDYEAFYRREMQTRKISQYPPFVFLIAIEVTSKNEEKCVQGAHDLKKAILAQGFEDVTVLGPIVPYYSFVAERHHRALLIKYKRCPELKPYLQSLQVELSGKGGIEFSFDVDPSDY